MGPVLEVFFVGSGSVLHCTPWVFENTFYLSCCISVFLTHFMFLVSFYSPLKTSETEKFSDVFKGYSKKSLV